MTQDTSGETRERMRRLGGKTAWIVSSIAAVFALFYIYTAGFGLISTELHRGLYILFTMLLCFLLYPARKASPVNRVSLMDWGLCLLVLIAVIYWIVEFPEYATERVRNPVPADIVMGIIITVLSLEVARRTINWVLPILASVFLLYAYFGRLVPGILGHPGFSIVNIVESIGCDMSGIYGIVANTYATFVFPFIIFASFLKAAGAGDAIENLAMAIAGGTRGGPAKVAVVSSGIIGSITGSSAANAVATGAYTIPLMKRTGYKAHVAAGVEAAASSGGQMLPPVMGAGAFLLATFTETAYLDIIKIAAIPAAAILFLRGLDGAFYCRSRRFERSTQRPTPKAQDRHPETGLPFASGGRHIGAFNRPLLSPEGRFRGDHLHDRPKLRKERNPPGSAQAAGHPHFGRQKLADRWGDGRHRRYHRGHYLDGRYRNKIFGTHTGLFPGAAAVDHHLNGACILHHGYGLNGHGFLCSGVGAGCAGDG